MKYLSKNQTVEEFNNTLKEGIENGFLLANPDLEFLKELCDNLIYYFTFFRIYNKDEIQSRKELLSKN